MRIISKMDWPGTSTELQDAVDAFAAAKEAHKETIGVPAPLADFEIVEQLVATGDAYILQADLPVDVPAAEPNVADTALDRQLAISFVMDQLITDAARSKNAPDYLVRAASDIAARVSALEVKSDAVAAPQS